MNRFKKQEDKPSPSVDVQPAPSPLRNYSEGPSGTPPSLKLFRYEVTAYWLLPLTIFCVILIGAIFVAIKYDLFLFGAEGEAALPPYISPSGKILAAELMDSSINAIGGHERLKGIRSVRYKGRITEQSGHLQFQILILLPDKGMIITRPGEANSQKIILNKDTAWLQYRGQNDELVLAALDANGTASLQLSLRVHNVFRTLAMDGASEGFTAREVEFLDKPCYELTKLMPNQSELRAILDAETLYVLQLTETVSHAGKQTELKVFYSDYRKVSGLMEAHQSKTYKDGQLYNEVNLDYMEINPGLMSSLFEVPTELTE